MYLKTQGLVLRVTEYRDSDALLSVLTREQGLMTFKARGVRSRRSQIKSACQLLAFSEFTVLERQGYYTVSEAVCIEMFQPMRNDIELLSLCSYFAQAAELLSQQDVNDGEVLSLTLNAIYALCKLKRPQPLGLPADGGRLLRVRKRRAGPVRRCGRYGGLRKVQRAGEPPASDQPCVSGCDAAYRELRE